jgi:serine/threonine-protein kinase
VHRDVSPQNILVGFDGTARVTDFGIAKAFGRTTRTSTGLLKGKMGYMSPEQLAFQHPDRRSDLFSLGVVLYEMLAGERLYSEDDPTDTAQRILKDPPPDIGEVREDVPIDVVALLFELLAKERDARPANAGIVAERLRAVIGVIALEHGPFSLPGWLEARFGGWREQQRAAVSRALEATRPGVKLPEMDALFAHRTPLMATSGFVRRVKNRTLWWVAAGAVVGTVAVTGAYLWASEGDDPMTREVRVRPEVSGEPSANREREIEETPAAVELPEVRVEATPEPGDEGEAMPEVAARTEAPTDPDTEEETEAARPDESRSNARSRRGRRAKKRVPIWGWE